MYKSFLAIVFIVLSVFIYLWQQETAIRLSYKVSDLQMEYDRINSENDFLRLKISSLLALDKMDKIAKEKNLFRPDENFVIYID